jgi:hypothetical protein
VLDKLCASNRIANTKGIKHLAWLLSKKSLVAHGHPRFDDDSVHLAVDKAEKFNAWAYNEFKEVLRGI